MHRPVLHAKYDKLLCNTFILELKELDCTDSMRGLHVMNFLKNTLFDFQHFELAIHETGSKHCICTQKVSILWVLVSWGDYLGTLSHSTIVAKDDLAWL